MAHLSPDARETEKAKKPRGSRELTVMEWKREINQGLEYRRKFGIEQRWSEVEALFYNVGEGQQNAGPNLIFSIGDSMMSSLNVPDPFIKVTPLRLDSVPGAPVLQSVDNAIVGDIGLKEEVENATLNAYLFSKGILKIGYDSEYGWDERLDLGLQEASEALGLTLTQMGPRQRAIEYNSNIKPGMPWVKSALPHDIVVPWGTMSFDSAPWTAHRVVRHVDDIKADPKYSNKRDLKGEMSMQDFVNSYLGRHKGIHGLRMGDHLNRAANVRFGGEADRDGEFVELWEIHDARTGKVYVITTEHSKFLRNEDDGLQIDGLPFVEVGFTPQVRSFWTTSDAIYLVNNHLELTDITIQKQKHRRLSVLKFGYKAGSIKTTELQRMLSGDVGAAFEYNDGFELKDSFATIIPQPNFSLQPEAEATRRDARELVGFSRNQQGEFESTGRRSATEASIVQRSSDTRLSRRAGKIQKAYRQIFEKINPLIFTYWRSPQIIQVLGEDGAQQWVNFTGDQLRGVYKYDITMIDKAQQQQDRQFGLAMFQALSGDPRVDQQQLVDFLTTNMNDPAFAAVFNQQGGGQQAGAGTGGTPVEPPGLPGGAAQ